MAEFYGWNVDKIPLFLYHPVIRNFSLLVDIRYSCRRVAGTEARPGRSGATRILHQGIHILPSARAYQMLPVLALIPMACQSAASGRSWPGRSCGEHLPDPPGGIQAVF
jgi:hypothetical protein